MEDATPLPWNKISGIPSVMGLTEIALHPTFLRALLSFTAVHTLGLQLLESSSAYKTEGFGDLLSELQSAVSRGGRDTLGPAQLPADCV